MSVTAPVEARVRRDFDADDADRVVARLSALTLPFHRGEDPARARGRERVHAAVVIRGAGEWPRFERWAAAAESDWRDVLVAAGLADDGRPARLDEQFGV